ncbi:Small G protein signaling modulator 1 [Camelus dromedarius]|uniref:Small G protein signaling modulator 1 n=1 Tax=Camelus dromedarius TaxID=9838 RepID=A0A5N4C5N8_CAMDR|nr:Small G protein signaling modulator 1 [Camelus dromedarius]
MGDAAQPFGVVSPSGCPVFQVKQIMEEAITYKCAHEDSSHIIFCAAVEACFLHGLLRQVAGFLRSNKIAALFMKVGVSFLPAEELSYKAQDLEQLIESARNQIQGLQENVWKLPKLPNLSPLAIKHLWIHTALSERVVTCPGTHSKGGCSKYYEKEALLMDPVDGPILASLLAGLCALECTKMKTSDHFWTDPSADELVQRHRTHSSHLWQDSPTKRPVLCIQKRHLTVSLHLRLCGVPAPELPGHPALWKNNILVQPRDDMEAVPGYLSLHQAADIMTLKWTPNQLMNGSVGDLVYEKSVFWDYAMTIRPEIVYLHCHQQVGSGGTVVLVSQDGIQRPPFRFPKGGHLLKFLSCLENRLLPHGQLDPPLWSQQGKGKVFPKLCKQSPQGSSESPSSDKEDDEASDYVFRIIYPSMQSEFVGAASLVSIHEWPSSKSTATTTLKWGSQHLPPRIIFLEWLLTHWAALLPSPWALPGWWFLQAVQTKWDTTLPTSCLKPQSLIPHDLMDVSVSNLPPLWQPSPRKSSCSSCSQSGLADGGSANGCNHERAPLKLLCDNMKYQILSRAFYGWLAYCRHLSTVRTHLSALVSHMIVSPNLPCDAGHGLMARIWEQYLQDSTSYEEQELLRLIYYRGIQQEICKAVWPFLLGHYQFRMTETKRKEVDKQIHACYAQTMSEWLGCKAIVWQRERESHMAALAKCSSGASLDSHLHWLVHRDSTISNETSACTVTPAAAHRSVDEVEQVDRRQTGGETAQDPQWKPGKWDLLPRLWPSFLPQLLPGPPGALGTQPEHRRQPHGCPEACPPAAWMMGRAARPHFPGRGPPLKSDLLANESVGEFMSITGSMDMALLEKEGTGMEGWSQVDSEDNLSEEPEMESLFPAPASLAVTTSANNEASPLSSSGVTFSPELLDLYTEDVQRCDRNYWYFMPANLEKLRNIMCRQMGIPDRGNCWDKSTISYVQGMCDLLVPLLVILDDEALTFSCFTELMKRKNQNFPHGELLYDDDFSVREVIWAARHVLPAHYVLFIALALVEVLKLAWDPVFKVQTLIENKHHQPSCRPPVPPTSPPGRRGAEVLVSAHDHGLPFKEKVPQL